MDWSLPIATCGSESSPKKAIVYTKEVVEELFKQLDLNGDGKISSNEFSRKEVDDSVAKAVHVALFRRVR